MAAGEGFEPSHTESEAGNPTSKHIENTEKIESIKKFATHLSSYFFFLYAFMSAAAEIASSSPEWV